MKDMLHKLSKMKKSNWDHWSLEEQKKLLEFYLVFCKKEAYIFDLIYGHHGSDDWERMFRDYDRTDLDEKRRGVQYAIRGIEQAMREDNEDTQSIES